MLQRLPIRRPNLFRSAAAVVVVKRNGSTSQHLAFQPVLIQDKLSPLAIKTPWLTAYKARERSRASRSSDRSEKVVPSNNGNKSPVQARQAIDKTRADSFSFTLLPFKDDEWFLDAYINSDGRLRLGQIFQDLDALAGVVAYKHCSPAHPVIVTASVDRIYMLKQIDDIANYNVTLSGVVTWTGKSSMEITIKAARHADHIDPKAQLTERDIKDEDVFLTANFTFVARDPDTGKAFAINPLKPQNPFEMLDFERAQHYNEEKRLKASQTALEVQPPMREETALIHQMWLRQKQISSSSSTMPTNMINMADTRVYSTAIMQPQYRNMHSYMIFGGYLLRQTFELAYSCAAAFGHSTPRFVSLDSTTFRAPVPVGSVLYLTATVAFTEQTNRTQWNALTREKEVVPGTLIQVRVDSAVRDLDKDASRDTGQFTYSYFVPSSRESQVAAGKTQVLPQTYGEMMEFVDGRRRARETAQFFVERELSLTAE